MVQAKGRKGVGAALVVLVLAVAATGLGVVLPLMRTATVEAEIAGRERALADIRQAERDAKSGVRTAPRGILIAAATEGQGGAALQQRLGELAEAAKVQIVSAQVLPVKRQGQIAEIAIVASVTSRIEGLRALLHALETELPLAVVDELAMRVLPTAPGNAGRQPVTIETTLRVRGFMATRGPV